MMMDFTDSDWDDDGDFVADVKDVFHDPNEWRDDDKDGIGRTLIR